MKNISIKNNNNINEDSKVALKEFTQQIISTNIRYYIILLIIFIITNIGLICFIIFYKGKIKEIKSLSQNYSSNNNSQNNELFQSSIKHKILNIASLNKGGVFRFSFFFENNQEYNSIKKIVYDYKTQFGEHTSFDIGNTFFLYQSIIDSDDYQKFMERISYFENIVIFIQTELGYKFGIFLKNLVMPDDNNEFEAISKDIFLYSFESKKVYNFIGNKKKSLAFKKDKLLIVGDDEIVVYNGYLTKGGFINYPLNSFDNNNKNVLTGQNGKFFIRNIEVFSFI